MLLRNSSTEFWFPQRQGSGHKNRKCHCVSVVLRHIFLHITDLIIAVILPYYIVLFWFHFYIVGTFTTNTGHFSTGYFQKGAPRCLSKVGMVTTRLIAHC